MTSPNAAESEPLSPQARSALIAMFVTLFIDLVGFSIIFPLFPAMLEHYLATEGTEGALGALVSGLERFASATGGPGGAGVTVLFGGVLGSLYSLLQFACAPILGSLSDRHGRRPILLLSIAGILVSYVMWFFAGSFLWLVLSRTIGGMMAGNISTASAVVADVTSAKNRSKGMALIGMAFGLGFILGPAIGGFTAMIDLTERWPGLADYGVNPFSAPALAAALLALVNLLFVLFRFKETLRPEVSTPDRPQRLVNPIALFRTDSYPGVTTTNLTNFVFLSVFSGMEFSLTFLAMDRFGYGPRDNAFIFLFVGLVLAGMQGGYVRRRSGVIGPKRMCLHGLITVAPGLALIGFAPNTPVLYVGLFFLAAGSAQVIPCLTALASLYAPAHEQGRVLGVFRSLGALARGVGPLVACLLYWRLGPTAAYAIGAAGMTVPILMAATLPPVAGTDGESRAS